MKLGLTRDSQVESVVATTSISGQLSKSLLGWICGLWVIGIAGFGWYMHLEISEGFDSALSQSALRLRELAGFEVREMLRSAKGKDQHDHDSHSESRPPAKDASDKPTERGSEMIKSDYLVYQVYDAAGHLIIHSEKAPLTPLTNKLDEGFSQNDEWRTFTLRDPDLGFIIHVADPFRHRRDAQRETMMWLMLPVLGMLPLLAFTIRQVTTKELRGLSKLAEEIGLRNGRNLSPIGQKGLPHELAQVAASTNSLLERLDGAMDVERTLAANTAHELRTPIAAVRLRLNNALSQDMPPALRHELDSADDSLEQLGRRVEKLLQLSRAESSTALTREGVDLGKLAAQVAQEFWQQAEAFKRLKLTLPEHVSPWAKGDVDTLALALRNLIENALVYSGDASVEIEVCEPASLVVRDSGPGVSPEILKTLSERHVRHARSQAGYGLGLSIVQTIVEKHGGTLTLRSPTPGTHSGFEAVIDLMAMA